MFWQESKRVTRVTSDAFQHALQYYIQSGTAEKVKEGILEAFGDGSEVFSQDYFKERERNEKLLTITLENELGGMNHFFHLGS